MTALDPNDYLGRTLGERVRLIRAEELAKSTRDAPWRLDVEVGSAARSYVLGLESRNIEHECQVLRAVESLPVPAPRAYGWDPAGEAWAEALYIETACSLQSVTRQQLASAAHLFGEGETAADVLELDSWRWVRATGSPYDQHTDDSLQADLTRWPGSE